MADTYYARRIATLEVEQARLVAEINSDGSAYPFAARQKWADNLRDIIAFQAAHDRGAARKSGAA